MDVEYVRNLNHNYIKITSCDDFFEYQVQMLTKNNIDGLLNCVVERVDNNVYFLYEISSKQPFVQLFERKKMNFEAFKALILCLKNAVENVGEYLLDVDSLLILPEYIFMNPETKDVGLIYLPGAWQDIKKEFRELSMKLLHWIDYKDEQAVSAAYELHCRTMEENYSLEEILKSILADDKEQELTEKIEKEHKVLNHEAQNVVLTESEVQNIVLPDYESEYRENTEAVEYLKDDMEMSDDEDCEENLSFFKKVTAPVFEAAGNLIKGIGLSNKEDEFEEDEYEPNIENVIKYNDYAENYNNYSMVAEEEVYGNTVFFQAASDKKKKLMAKNSKKYNEFDLNIFPFIIGKMMEAVDGVIEDESVSRIHAKVEKTDGQYYLVDLNSTNGTFLNGKIIPPNEKTKLQTGDRIQFGFVEYYFENK